MDDINVDSEEEMEVDDMDERQFSMKLIVYRKNKTVVIC
jgi:hypothetical protein